MTSESIKLKWDSPEAIDTFVIDVKKQEDENLPWTEAHYKTEKEHLFEGLEEYTVYQIRVMSVNEDLARSVPVTSLVKTDADAGRKACDGKAPEDKVAHDTESAKYYLCKDDGRGELEECDSGK